VTFLTGIETLWTLQGAVKKDGRHLTEDDLSPISDGAMVLHKDTIKWVGSRAETKTAAFRRRFKGLRARNLGAKTVLPGFIDCHTHLVFSGDRQSEFELRNRGYSYEEIAKNGGGILKTVTATRAATELELTQLAQPRADRAFRQGVTTLEVKSGYGLDFPTEEKILKVARKLKGPRIVTTFLGAHSVPAEFRNGPQPTKEYLKHVIDWLPRLKRWADRVDIYIDRGFFDLEDGRALFAAARNQGMSFTAHTDQLHHTGASAMAAHAGAVSVDHCIKVSDQDVKTLSTRPTTCVLLPTSDFYLRCEYPPARRLLEAGARVALATDFNPGTSPTQDLSLVGVLARLEMKMTWFEVIAALTINGAHALGFPESLGALEEHRRGDFVVLDCDARDLFYQVGHHPIREVWKDSACKYK
jgi:imidazolonepropionase